MPKGHPALSEVQKKEIVARVSENGERVPDLAREFNVHSKVKRENEALLTIIGSLVAESKLGKKKK